MRSFAFYKKNDDVQIVSDGLHFFAACFPVLWLLFKKAWLAFFILLLFTIITGSLAQGNAVYLMQIGQFLIFLFAAEDILSWSLERAGYEFEDVVFANNEQEAELVYTRRNYISGGSIEL